MIVTLLILQGLLAVALLGAITHQTISVWLPARKSARSFVGRVLFSSEPLSMRPALSFHVNAKRWLVIWPGAMFIVLCSSPTSAQIMPLRYGQAYSAARSIFSLPVAVGDREGFFRREGLNFSVIIPIPGGSDKMIDALHDDTVDVTHVASPFLIRAALKGSDAVAI